MVPLVSMGEPTYDGWALVKGAGSGLGLKARVKARTTRGGIPMYKGSQLS
uniref:Uncharacterized protein n=1 Tax=Arundo donax TaxID=35708 RepID=A0A0A9CQS0_ARUDO